MLVAELDRLADGGQHAERQDVHLEHAHRLGIVLVPFHDGARIHAGVAHRHQFAERAVGDDEPPHVLGEVAREALQFLGGAQDGLDQSGVCAGCGIGARR